MHTVHFSANLLGLRSAEVEAKSDAKSVGSSEQSDDGDEAQADEDTKKKRKRVGFRDRKVCLVIFCTLYALCGQ